MNFETELKKGKFLVSECPFCKIIVWPPSDFCNRCLKENSWKECSCEGKILEFSKKENTIFCVAEIEKSLKILGEIISGTPEIGKKIKVVDCGITNNNYFFKMAIIE